MNKFLNFFGIITRRDYFAAQAMQSLISNPTTFSELQKCAGFLNTSPYDLIALSAYGAADAMIKQKNK